MKIDCLKVLNADQLRLWQDFLNRARHTHPEQDPRFAGALRGDGYDVVYTMGWSGPELRAVGLFGLRRHALSAGFHSHAMAHSGPVCDGVEDLAGFVDGLVRHPAFARVGAIRITPYWLGEEAPALAARLASAGWRAFETTDYRMTGISDIAGTAEEIAARFSQTGRRKLRKAERLGLTVEPVRDAPLAMDFLLRLNAHRAPRGLPAIREARFMAAFRDVSSTEDLGVLLVVRHEGRLLSGVLLHKGRDTAHLINSFQDEALLAELGDVRIAPFMLFQGMKWANARGCRFWDWEGYLTGLDPSHPLYGVNKYKDDFSPRQIARLPGQQKIGHPSLYLTGNAREILRPHAKALLGRLKRR